MAESSRPPRSRGRGSRRHGARRRVRLRARWEAARRSGHDDGVVDSEPCALRRGRSCRDRHEWVLDHGDVEHASGVDRPPSLGAGRHDARALGRLRHSRDEPQRHPAGPRADDCVRRGDRRDRSRTARRRTRLSRSRLRSRADRSQRRSRDGVLLVDGSSFFPLIAWQQCPDQWTPNLDQGIDLFAGNPCTGLSSLLTALQGRALAVGTSDDAPATGPGLIGWFYPDEADGRGLDAATLPAPPAGGVRFLTLTNHFYDVWRRFRPGAACIRG